jgi:Zn finger protein HypA/HybF involved in hydrogenase expression
MAREAPFAGILAMVEGYCVKCKARKEIAEAVEEVMKNGRKAIKGKCPSCSAVMFKIIGGKASTAPSEHESNVPETSHTSLS